MPKVAGRAGIVATINGIFTATITGGKSNSETSTRIEASVTVQDG
jgi:hypothetical protein